MGQMEGTNENGGKVHPGRRIDYSATFSGNFGGGFGGVQDYLEGILGGF